MEAIESISPSNNVLGFNKTNLDVETSSKVAAKLLEGTLNGTEKMQRKIPELIKGAQFDITA